VADFGNSRIRQIVIATQTVTTLAGSGTAGSANGVGTAAQFANFRGLAVDPYGNLFVGDTGNQLIRQIVIATQTVTTVAGTGTSAWIDNFGTNSAFDNPIGLATDARGNVFIADHLNHRVRVMQPSAPCAAGVYCAAGTSSAVPAVPCPAGSYCATPASALAACAQGYYCPAGSTSATQVACLAGAFHCPAGSAVPVSIACAVGYDFVYVCRFCLQCKCGSRLSCIASHSVMVLI
jgi:hypothetical protein